MAFRSPLALCSWSILLIGLQRAALAFAVQGLDGSCLSSSSSSSSGGGGGGGGCLAPGDHRPPPPAGVVDPELASRRIRSGRVYVHPGFLSEEQLSLLRRDMARLEDEEQFVVNGLSDVRKGLKGEPTSSSSADGSDFATSSRANQGFDVKYDRSVCPIPWWKDALALPIAADDEAGDETDDDESLLLRSVQVKLQRLRHELAAVLDRPTMMDDTLGHECYYSQSTPGTSLARHMDERHEETKGPRGWLLPSRRSLSWLIYLSETGDGAAWDAETNGGLLRTFPQKSYRNDGGSDGQPWEGTVECGSHNGNLQVGWLLADQNDEKDNDAAEVADGGERVSSSTTHPVFLDSWYEHINPYTGAPEPHCVLYIIRRKQSDSDADDDESMQIEYITVPWSIDAVGGGSVSDFLQHRARLESSPSDSAGLFLRSGYASKFRLLEDREAWTRGEAPEGSVVEDFVPSRGTLVVFDSVTLPHEVTAVVEGSQGRRSALAGWFHEVTQPLGGTVL